MQHNFCHGRVALDGGGSRRPIGGVAGRVDYRASGVHGERCGLNAAIHRNFGRPASCSLAASDSLESLRRAFPNYYLDTETFVREMDLLLS